MPQIRCSFCASSLCSAILTIPPSAKLFGISSLLTLFASRLLCRRNNQSSWKHWAALSNEGIHHKLLRRLPIRALYNTVVHDLAKKGFAINGFIRLLYGFTKAGYIAPSRPSIVLALTMSCVLIIRHYLDLAESARGRIESEPANKAGLVLMCRSGVRPSRTCCLAFD